jgi:hypothetical protein
MIGNSVRRREQTDRALAPGAFASEPQSRELSPFSVKIKLNESMY